MAVSFSGAGLMAVYHIGAAKRIHEVCRAAVKVWAGASSGAIVAAAMAVGLDPAALLRQYHTVANTVREQPLGVLTPGFHLVDAVRRSIDEEFPPDAHERAGGKLYIAVTKRQSQSYKADLVLQSTFTSRTHLIDTVIASCILPGLTAPLRLVELQDGGLLCNWPAPQQDTITISPFTGDFDICPAGVGRMSASFQGHSLPVNAYNLMATWRSFAPAPDAVVEAIIRQGYDDTARFLAQTGKKQKLLAISVEPTGGAEGKAGRVEGIKVAKAAARREGLGAAAEIKVPKTK